MAAKITCPRCKALIGADSVKGNVLQCPQCKGRFRRRPKATRPTGAADDTTNVSNAPATASPKPGTDGYSLAGKPAEPRVSDADAIPASEAGPPRSEPTDKLKVHRAPNAAKRERGRSRTPKKRTKGQPKRSSPPPALIAAAAAPLVIAFGFAIWYFFPRGTGSGAAASRHDVSAGGGEVISGDIVVIDDPVGDVVAKEEAPVFAPVSGAAAVGPTDAGNEPRPWTAFAERPAKPIPTPPPLPGVPVAENDEQYVLLTEELVGNRPSSAPFTEDLIEVSWQRFDRSTGTPLAPPHVLSSKPAPTKERPTPSEIRPPLVAALSADGQSFAAEDPAQGDRVLVQSSDGAALCAFAPSEQSQPIAWMAWTASGDLLTRAGGEIAAWSMPDAKSIWKLPLDSDAVVAPAPGRGWLAVSSANNVLLVDAATGKSRGQLRYEGAAPVYDVAVAPNELRLAALHTTTRDRDDSSGSVELVVWDLQSGTAIKAESSPTALDRRLQWINSDLLFAARVKLKKRVKGKSAGFLVDLRGPELTAALSLPEEAERLYQLDSGLWVRRPHYDGVKGENYHTHHQVRFLDRAIAEHQPLFELAAQEEAPALQVRVELACDSKELGRKRAETAARYLQKQGVQIGPGGYAVRIVMSAVDSGFELTGGLRRIPIPGLDIHWYLVDPNGKELWTAYTGEKWLTRRSKYALSPAKSRALARKEHFRASFNNEFVYYDFPTSDYHGLIVEEMLSRDLENVNVLSAALTVLKGRGDLGVPKRLADALEALAEDANSPERLDAVRGLLVDEGLELTPGQESALRMLREDPVNASVVKSALEELRRRASREEEERQASLPLVAVVHPTSEELTGSTLPTELDRLSRVGLKAELELPLRFLDREELARRGLTRESARARDRDRASSLPDQLAYADDSVTLEIASAGYALRFDRKAGQWRSVTPMPAWDHSAKVRDVSPKLDRVAVSNESSISVLDATDPSKAVILPDRRADHRCVAFSPDGKYLACGTNNRGVLVWDVARAKPALEVPKALNETPMAFSPDGSWFGLAGRQIKLWNFPRFKEVSEFAIPEIPGDTRNIGLALDSRLFLFSANGARMACADGTVLFVWDVRRNGRRVKAPLEPVAYHQEYRIRAAALDGTGSVAATQTFVRDRRGQFGGSQIWVWDVDTGALRRRIDLDGKRFVLRFRIALSPAGDELAVATDDRVLLFDVASSPSDLYAKLEPPARVAVPDDLESNAAAKELATSMVPKRSKAFVGEITVADAPAEYTDVTFAADGATVCVAAGGYFVFDAATHELVREMRRPLERSEELVASAVSPLHDMAAFVEKEKTVVVHSADGKEPTLLDSGKDALVTRPLALFSPDGNRLYTTHYVEGKEVIRAWDVRRGRMVGESGDRRRVERAAVARDGSLFAGADYQVVRLFHPKTLAPISEIPAPTDARDLSWRLGAVTLSADGDALAAAVAMPNSRGNDVYLWASESGLQMWRDDDVPVCLPQIGNVDDLLLSSDGKLLITAVQNARSRSSWINVFEAGTGKILAKLGPLNRGLQLDLSADDRLLAVATKEEVMLFDLPMLLQR